ncbi:RNA binding protein [Aspergillus rambellii]|uniref:RNA binding protein n=1 Tax=Aspergillus rambellii TaxID=308745 RepID=A0A0F8VRS4_9EURO|nr:RNA binding protein [Aspergillus rambellii]
MASQNTTPSAVSSSGITVDAVTGERYIPSSVRADGSKRREIRVRPGYRPPEDVELYKNRAAEAWKNRGKTGGVPGAEGLKEPEPTKPSSAASNKNAKRREAKKKAKGTPDGAVAGANGKDISQIDNWRASSSPPGDKKPAEGPEAPAAEVDLEAEREKKARNLKKKLRQARDLNDKKNQGEALLPEQLEKVIKIQELVRQLEALGFDGNGEKTTTEEKPEK